MKEKIKVEELNEFEKLVAIIMLKTNSDRALKNEKVESVSMEYLQSMIKFLEDKGLIKPEYIS